MTLFHTKNVKINTLSQMRGVFNMVREIMRDESFLAKKAIPTTKDDMQDAIDLKETLQAHDHHCVGMAANMIGVNKAIIAIKTEQMPEVLLMFNPKIVKKSAKSYKVQEGCLSLEGQRDTVRYENIEVSYRDIAWRKQKEKFSGWTAQVIQHEIDHLDGIII